MTTMTLRATAVLVALATTSASLLASVPTAAAATTVEAAAAAFQFSDYTVTEVTGSGDITSALVRQAATPGTSYQPHVVLLPAGAVTVSRYVPVADNVYLVAEPSTTINWRGSDSYLLRFRYATGGVYGGTWDGDKRGTTSLISLMASSVRLIGATVRDAGKDGVSAYTSSAITLSGVTTTGNKRDGVHLEGSTLHASGLQAVSNRRNGVQLSSGSRGSIDASVLDRNGQAVSGSTTGKTGHGLGLSDATATVTGTTMSRNKVCGVSLTHSASVTIDGGALDSNGRHGLGTEAGTRATIAGATVRSNGYNGILASGSGTLVKLVQVTVTNAKRSGLSVPSGGAAEITGTTIAGAHGYDISVSGKGHLSLLGGNTVSASSRHGITVSGKGSIVITGEGNLVTGSRGDGLRITGSGTTGRIEQTSSFVKNRDSGIVVVSKAKLWMVPNCYFAGNKKSVEKRSGGKLYNLA
jgi:hypothetical protein